jgi:hypothetical protein
MKNLKESRAGSLCWSPRAWRRAQQATVPSRIKVAHAPRASLPAMRAVRQQSKLQYNQMLNEAHKKDAVATDTNPQLIRLRAIAKRIIPFTTRWNPDAAKWDWQVNLLNPTPSTPSACRAAASPSTTAS